MKLSDSRSIDQLRDFFDGTQAVAFAVVTNKDERYRWMQQTLIKFRYRRLSKADKGIVIGYLMKVSGYSRQQVTRLIGKNIQFGQLWRRYRFEDVQTPYEKFKSLSDAAQNLKASVTIETLDAIAAQCSDNEAARRLRTARKKLFFQSTNCSGLKLKGKEHRSIAPIFQLRD